MDHSRSRRDLNNGRAVQFGDVEVPERTGGDINGGRYGAEAPGVRVEDPGHIIRPGPHRLGDLHEHADDPARPVHPKDVADPAPIELDIRTHHRPFLVAVPVPPDVVFVVCRHCATSIKNPESVVLSNHKSRAFHSQSGSRYSVFAVTNEYAVVLLIFQVDL